MSSSIVPKPKDEREREKEDWLGVQIPEWKLVIGILAKE
jgi:hypothetical protein